MSGGGPITDAERLDWALRAGDILAEMLGYSLAALEARERFTETRLDAARNGIIVWHQLKRIAAE